MEPAAALCLLLLAVAAWLADRRARRIASHRPVVQALVAFLFADVLRKVACVFLGHLAGDTRPYIGAARAVYHAQELLFVGWGAVLCALVVATFGEGSRRRLGLGAIGVAMLAVEAGLLVSYPLHRGVSREATYGVLHLAWTVAALACFVTVLVRESRTCTTLARVVSPPRECALWTLAAAMAVPSGPYLRSMPSRDWPSANAISAFVLVALIVRHLQWIRGSGQPSPCTLSGAPLGSSRPA